MIFRFFKGMFKTSLVTTAVLVAVAGGAILIAGTDRTRAVMSHVHGQVTASIDRFIDDPVAMRVQLQALEREYPKRIAAVNADLSELNEQVRQLMREKSISERVVALADRDIEQLQRRVEEVRTASLENGHARLAAVVFDDQIYSFRRAKSKVNNIRMTRAAHANRAADAEHDLTYLRQQAERFEDLLGQLQAERAQFQTQIFQLERQVDSIERNQRLIRLLEKRQRTLDACSSFEVTSLDQLTGKLSQIRMRQEAELEVLANSQRQVDYVEMARMQLREETLPRASEPEVDSFELVPVGD